MSQFPHVIPSQVSMQDHTKKTGRWQQGTHESDTKPQEHDYFSPTDCISSEAEFLTQSQRVKN